MNFVLVGSRYINVAQIVEILKVNANSYTVFLSNQVNYPNLTYNQIQPILSVIGAV